MEFYDLDRKTGELANGGARRKATVLPGREHLPDDDAKKWYIPAHITRVDPPEHIEGKARCRLDAMPPALREQAEDAGNGWGYVPDHRTKKVYCTKTCREMEVKELGTLPDTVTTEKPPAEFGYEFKDGTWAKLPEPEPGVNLLAELDELKAMNANLMARLEAVELVVKI